MKKTRITLALLAFLAPFLFILLFTSGCTVDEHGKRRLNIYTYSTNQVGEVTADLSDSAKAALETAKDVNRLANPTGTGPAVEWGLGILGTLATLVGTWKAGKKNGAKPLDRAIEVMTGAVEKGPLTPELKDTLRGIIARGIEAGQSIEDIWAQVEKTDWSKGLKTQIAADSIKADVSGVIHRAVVKGTKGGS